MRENDHDEEDSELPPMHVAPSFGKPLMAIPEVVLRVLESEDRAELLEVARLLDAANQTERNIIFYTPIGDVKCRINWRSASPDDLRRTEGIMFVKLRSAVVAFVPKTGAVFDVGFEDYEGRLRVICLAQQQLYPGVDLLCFMLHTPEMEKQGVLRDGAPSVVSGKPSVSVDSGEPVADNEKSASADALASVSQIAQPTDFDRARE